MQKQLQKYKLDLNDQQNYYPKHLATQHEFYLTGPILEPENYIQWFDIIRNASDTDTIRIYINSVGGNVDTAIQFRRVLSDTNAEITCSVEGSCMSAATMIFLCADNFEITPNSLFMFHNYSSGMVGKGGELYDQAVFERKWSTKFLQEVYEDFLTEAEVSQLLNNRDLWLDSDEVLTRCELLVEARAKAYQKINNETTNSQ